MIGHNDLTYFLEVAKTQHVSRAAERLGITQPALSHCLKRIESEVGCELFVRSKKGVSLTSAGQKLYEQAQELLSQWDRVLTSVHEDTHEVSGLVKFGCHTAVAQYSLPRFMPQLLEKHPKLEIQLHHGLSRHLTEQIISSKIDVTLAVNPVAHPDLVIRELCRDKVTIWKSRGCKNPSVLLADSNLLQVQDVLRRAGKQGLRFERKIESSSLEVIAQLLVAGVGCAVLPERVIKAMSDTKVEVLKGAPVFEDRMCLVFKREFMKTARGKAIVENVREAFSE